MKIFIRHNGLVGGEWTLDPDREYLLGRAEECDIRLTQDFISRKHAKIYFQNGTWYFQDLRIDHKDYRKDPRPIEEDTRIEMDGGMELVTNQYLSLHKTGTFDLGRQGPQKEHPKRGPLIAFLSLLILLLGGAGGYYAYQRFQLPMETNELLKQVRPKIVEFEEIRDEAVINEIKKYANLTDDDFKESSGYCSGFIVGENVVLTASHCVLGPYGLAILEGFTIKTDDKKTFKPGRVLGFDIDYDYLFLEVPGLKETKPLKLESNYKIGEKVFTIGNVQGQGIAIRDGITSSKTKSEDNPAIEFLRFSAGASPGNSGGPLVNAKGDVIGLVFARSNLSENYNVATDALDLIAGMKKFVENRENKKVVAIDTKQYNPMFYENLFGIPFPYEWRDHPEITKKLNEIKIELTVPVAADGISQSIFEPFYQKFKEKFEEVKVAIEKEASGDKGQDNKGMVASEWELHANAQTPLIIPFPQYDEISIIDASENYFSESNASLYLPADPQSYNYFKEELEKTKTYRYRAGELYAGLPWKKDQTYNGVFQYEKYPKEDKRELYSLKDASVVFIDYTLSQDLDSIRFVPNEKIGELILGEKGLLISYIRNHFLRPNRFTPFTLKELPAPMKVDKEDKTGRKWSKTTWQLFGELVIDLYCLPLPQGYACLKDLNEKTDIPYLEGLREKAFVDNLAQILVRPKFWNTDPLIDFLKRGHAKALKGFEDIKLSNSEDGGLEIKLFTLGLTFKIGKEKRPKMLRFLPALYYHEGKPRWIMVGFTGYYPRENKEEMKFCGADIQLKEIPAYVFSVKYQWESDTQFKEMKGKGKPKKVVETKNYTIKALQKEAIIATFCQPAQKTESGYSFGEYQPFLFEYTIEN